MYDYSNLENIKNGVMEVDNCGHVLWCNQKALWHFRRLGMKPPRNIKDVCPTYTDGNKKEGSFFWLQCPDGMMAATTSSVKFGGSIHHILLTYPYGEAKDVIQMTMDYVEEIVIVATQMGEMVMINKKAREILKSIFRLNPDKLLGKSIMEAMRPFVAAENELITPKVIQAKRSVEHMVHYNHQLVILYTAVPVFQEGLFTHIILTGRNVAQLVHLQAELETSQRLNEEYSKKMLMQDEHRAEGVIYSSKAMEMVLELAKRSAHSDASVFITGESGVGKEVLAKFIHTHSTRKDSPFLAVNCAAIPKDLMESEFFGYTEGAFTGARKGGAKGLLEESSGGTIFLDEIGELPAAMQSKLLRVLQDGKVYPLGSSKYVDVDVRYISATNLSMRKLRSEEIFRQDLYYRLSVIPLHIPPLHERRDDILPLVQHFLSACNEQHQRKIVLSPAALDFLFRLEWSGNVRQLKNFVERIVVLAPENEEYVLREDVQRLFEMENDRSQGGQSITVGELLTLNEAHENLDAQLIQMALDRYGTVPKAAKALGVPPSTIYRKLKP